MNVIVDKIAYLIYDVRGKSLYVCFRDADWLRDITTSAVGSTWEKGRNTVEIAR